MERNKPSVSAPDGVLLFLYALVFLPFGLLPFVGFWAVLAIVCNSCRRRHIAPKFGQGPILRSWMPQDGRTKFREGGALCQAVLGLCLHSFWLSWVFVAPCLSGWCIVRAGAGGKLSGQRLPAVERFHFSYAEHRGDACPYSALLPLSGSEAPLGCLWRAFGGIGAASGKLEGSWWRGARSRPDAMHRTGKPLPANGSGRA